MLDKRSIKHVHLVGVGGIGVGGIAEYLLRQGFKVTGSDVGDNKMTAHLRSLGAEIFVGHDAGHVGDADVVVYSSACREGNPEVAYARDRGMHLLQRAEMLAELMMDSKNILIAGTHGKTTTTGLVSAVLTACGLDPSYMIGGRLNNMLGPTQLGTGAYFIAEADESDASFLSLHPEIAVITNLEPDHMGTYEYDFSMLEKAFVNFLKLLPERGVAVMGADDPGVAALIKQCEQPVLTYGFEPHCDFQTTRFSQNQMVSTFDVKRPDGSQLSVQLNLPGKHNVQNAMAAIAVAYHLQLDDAGVLQALAEFAGMGRRFHVLGRFQGREDGPIIVDDYGHHPSAISATLATARLVWPEKRVILVYQPHRYTRTRDLFDDFVDALSLPDALVLLKTFAAGEAPIETATSIVLSAAVAGHGTLVPEYVEDLADLPSLIASLAQPDDVVILQGAGDIGTMPHQLVRSDDT